MKAMLKLWSELPKKAADQATAPKKPGPGADEQPKDGAKPPPAATPPPGAKTPPAATSPPAAKAGGKPTAAGKPAAGGDSEIKKLQESLKAAGYDPGPIDGKMGPLTKEAIKKFQQANGLAVDGIAGSKTKTALAGAKPPAAPPTAPKSGSGKSGGASGTPEAPPLPEAPAGTKTPRGRNTPGRSSLASIEISPRVKSISVGDKQQFRAMGKYADGTSEDLTPAVEWSSSSPDSLSIDSRGAAVAGPRSGRVSLTARDPQSHLKDSIDFVVEQGHKRPIKG
jgi:peptidoglycan hydrolase-like protein with peptidoglycan-binding domain